MRGAKYRRRIVISVTQILAIFSEVFFQKCGSLFPQKNNFLLVFYSVINIQLS